MPMKRLGLLVTLVLVSVALAASFLVHDSAAASRGWGGDMRSARIGQAGAVIESGEPDVGQTNKQPNPSDAPVVVAVARQERLSVGEWLRLASGIWMARFQGLRH